MGNPVDDYLAAEIAKKKEDGKPGLFKAAYGDYEYGKAPSVDPQSATKAYHRVTDALPDSGVDLIRGAVRNPGHPLGQVTRQVEWLASFGADEDGLARDLWETITGEEWLDEPMIAERRRAGEISPIEEQEARRRQAPLASLPAQAADFGRAIGDIPVQAMRGVTHMAEDVLEGRPGQALLRPATTTATVVGEMVRSALLTSQGATAGRELEAGLDVLAGGGGALKGAKALAAGEGAGRVAYEAGKGFLVGDEQGRAALLETMREAGQAIPGLTARFPGRTKELVTDARFEAAAESKRALDEVGVLRDEDAMLAEAALTQGEELVPLAREQVANQRRAMEAMDAADPEHRRIAEDVSNDIPFEEILQDPELTSHFLVNHAEEVKRLRRNEGLGEARVALEEELAKAEGREAEASLAMQEKLRALRERTAEREGRAGLMADRSTRRAVSRVEDRMGSAEAKLDVSERARESLGLKALDQISEGERRFKVEDKAAHGRLDTREWAGFDRPRRVGWTKKERAGLFRGATQLMEETELLSPSTHKTVGEAVRAGRTEVGAGALAGQLDAVNEALGLRGTRRIIDPLHGWLELTKGARSIDDLRAATEAMRGVRGMERFDPLGPHSKLGQKLQDFEVLKKVRDEQNRGILRHRRATSRLADFRGQQRAGRAAGRTQEQARGANRKAAGYARRLKEMEAEIKRLERKGGPISPEQLQAMKSAGRAIGIETEASKGLGRSLRAEAAKARRIARQIERLDKKMAKPAPRVHGPLRGDPVGESLRALEKVDRTGGARLTLAAKNGVETMNTPRAALLDLGKRNLAEEAAAGRLRFTHPQPETAAWLNKAVLPMVVRINEMGNAKVALNIPGIGAEQMRAQATNYVRAYYDAAKARRFKVTEAREAIADLVEELEQGVRRGEIDEAAAQTRLVQEAERQAAKIPETSGRALGRQFGIFGKTDMGMMKRATSKFRRARSAQIERGRWDGSRVQETLSRMMIEQNRTISNHALFRRLASTEHVLEHAADMKKLKDIHLGIRGHGRHSVPAFDVGGKKYVQMPDGRERWGDLAGKLVDQQLAQRLVEVNRAEAGLYSKILTLWKTNKVVNNFSSQFHIAVGNSINQIFDGGTPADMWSAGKKYLKQEGWLHDATRDAGLYEGLVMDIELDLVARRQGIVQVMTDLYGDAKFYSKHQERAAVIGEILAQRSAKDAVRVGVDLAEWVTNNVAGLGGLTKRLFTAQEMMSRMAILERYILREAKRTGRAASELAKDQAVLKAGRKHVMEIQLDYGDLPEWAQTLRGTGVVPFISYPYKATGMFLRQAVKKPQQAHMLAATERSLYILSPQEEKDRRDFTRDYRARYNVPLTKDHDIFLRYVSPLALFPITELGTAMGPRDAGVRNSGSLGMVPAHVKWMLEVANNEDDFYRKPIWDPISDDATTKTWKAILHGAKSMGPSYVTRSINNIYPAATGGRTARGEDLSVLEAILNTAGIRVTKKDPIAQTLEMSFKVNDAKRYKQGKWRRGAATNAMSAQQLAQESQDLTEYISRLILQSEMRAP